MVAEAMHWDARCVWGDAHMRMRCKYLNSRFDNKHMRSCLASRQSVSGWGHDKQTLLDICPTSRTNVTQEPLEPSRANKVLEVEMVPIRRDGDDISSPYLFHLRILSARSSGASIT